MVITMVTPDLGSLGLILHVTNKKWPQSMYNTEVCHYGIKHYLLRHVLGAEFRHISERKISM
jgi:hypothetical protein